MRMMLIYVPIVILISLLSACSNNVVPKRGPTMEEVYDGMGRLHSPQSNHDYKQHELISFERPHDISNPLPKNRVNKEFQKLPNPLLYMYVFPHLAGKDEIPVPGYFTVFNAYERDYYALPHEMVRG